MSNVYKFIGGFMKKLLPLLLLMLLSCSNNSNPYSKVSTQKMNKLDRWYNGCEVSYDEVWRCKIDYYEKSYESGSMVITYEKHWLIYPTITIVQRGVQNYTTYDLATYDNETRFVLLVSLPK